MSFDTTSIIEDAIRETVEMDFQEIPIRLRTKHISKIEDINASTVWRWYTAGKIPKPCRDERGLPWWPRESYKADLLKRLLVEARHAQG